MDSFSALLALLAAPEAAPALLAGPAAAAAEVAAEEVAAEEVAERTGDALDLPLCLAAAYVEMQRAERMQAETTGIDTAER